MIKQVLSDDIIKQYLPILTACPLFNTLGIPELTSYLHNAKVIINNYKKERLYRYFRRSYGRNWRYLGRQCSSYA